MYGPAYCSICWEKPARYECKICHRKVCEDHYDPETGLCSLCKATLCEICGRRLSVGYCSVCGRLGCSECLVQIDNVRRVCKGCLAKLGLKNIKKHLSVKPIGGPVKVTLKILHLRAG